MAFVETTETIEDETETKLLGKTFCITGKLSQPRKQIESWIINLGGKITSAASCDILVCNEVSSSSKYKQAIKRGILIMTEEDLFEMGE